MKHEMTTDTIPVVIPLPVSEPDSASSLPVVTEDTLTHANTPLSLSGQNVVIPTIVDSVSKALPDSAKVSEPVYGIVLTAPQRPEVLLHSSQSTGMSIILGALTLLFCVVGLRFRNNRKYVTALWQNLTEVRIRSNVFDETVRETSFLILLNLLWSFSAGIIMWGVMSRYVELKVLTFHPATSMAICMGVATVYTFVMIGVYFVSGWVFSDTQHALIWVKGFTASQGLMSFVMLPVALILLFYPVYATILLWIGAASFVVGKLMFIWKGGRIFLVQSSSWVLFLYYLCSLEIVPLILSFLAAMGCCRLL